MVGVCRDFRPARKSFLGGVSGFGLTAGGKRERTDFDGAGDGTASLSLGASTGVSSSDLGAAVFAGCTSMEAGFTAGVFCTLLASSSVLTSSLSGEEGFNSTAGINEGEGCDSLLSSFAKGSNFEESNFSASSFGESSFGESTFGESRVDLRSATGLSWTSLIGDVGREPSFSPKGVPKGLPLPRSTLPRCCFARLSSAIHAGCCGDAGAIGFGDSGLFSAFSSQLDFVGLNRFDGLEGRSPSSFWSLLLKVEWTDLLRL